MSLLSAAAIFFIVWWVMLFAVLPFGVRTQEEDGSIVPGSVPSAPARFRLWRTAGINTLVSAVVFAVIYFAITQSWITLADLVPVERGW